VGLVALVGLGLAHGSPLPGLAARGPLWRACGAGIAMGLALVLADRLVRGLPALARLEEQQRAMIGGWALQDAVAVAILSGLTEEALARALLQPLIGLVPAAIVFGLLHIAGDRRLWLWPVLAFIIGLALGGTFELGGYPAAATAHAVINMASLLRLRSSDEPAS